MRWRWTHDSTTSVLKEYTVFKFSVAGSAAQRTKKHHSWDSQLQGQEHI